MKVKILLIIVFLANIINAQINSADQLINQIKQKINKVNDYSVDVEVSVKMDFLKMPNSKAKLFFKKPDKFKFHSEGFAVLPKAGVDFNPQQILENDISSEIIEDTLLSDPDFKLIKITPNADSLKFLSANLLINQTRLVIEELTLSPTEGANITTKFSYDELEKFALPSKLEVIFNISDEIEKPMKNNRRSRVPTKFSGIITITYSDYTINKGIDNSIFENDEEEQNEKKNN